MKFLPWRILKPFFFGGLIGAALLFVFLTLAIIGFKREYQHRVYPGIFLGSVSVSGKTSRELEVFLQKEEEKLFKQKVSFFWAGEADQTWEVTPGVIDFSFDRQETVRRVFALGRKEPGLKSLGELYRLVLFPQAVEAKFNFSQERLDAVVASMSAIVNRPVEEALFEFKDGRVLNFQPSQIGRAVQEEETKNVIILAFSGIPSRSETLNLSLPVKQIEPQVTTDQSNSLGIREALGEGESFFFDSIPSRVHNIALATSRFHGVVISPGEVFSFAQKIGTVSAETGYQQAYVIREKKTVLEDGGGVCQVSTTLFRAVLNAGLPIIERQPHYYRVSFYEQGGYPPGLDATVYPPSPDLKFKNDNPFHILIQTSFDKVKRRLAFTLYGTKDGRRIEVLKPIVHSQTPPPEPTYIDDPTLPVGELKQTDKPHWGAKVSFKRTVWFSSGEVKEEREFWSNYTAWPAVYSRGTKPL